MSGDWGELRRKVGTRHLRNEMAHVESAACLEKIEFFIMFILFIICTSLNIYGGGGTEEKKVG